MRPLSRGKKKYRWDKQILPQKSLHFPEAFFIWEVLMKSEAKILDKTTCYHCGDECTKHSYDCGDKHFCCEGCRLVYEILNKNELCTYYDLEKNPGISRRVSVRPGKFAFLDDEKVIQKLCAFRSADQSTISLYLPQVHCSSCIWLLENLNRLNKGIISSRVNFLKKEISLRFRENETSLKNIAELLTQIGYEPHISLHDLDATKIKKYDRSRIYKIGIAGFCFGNIMMLSFPEYFSFGQIQEKGLKEMFSYLNLALSLPVLFYCDNEFFISAWKGMKQRFLNIDAPIALAIVITFLRSLYEILWGIGPGYLDSMTGIVFFMLLGRFFQDRTYQALSFDRDYTSYFPVAVTVMEEDGEKQVLVSDLKTGQRIRIHSNEIIPADAILFLGEARVDYSFVTGESVPVKKTLGEIIYAGGKQTAGSIELEIVKEVSQSYLTQLWNKKNPKDENPEKKSYIHKLSKYFTGVLFTIALTSAVYWQINNPGKTWKVLTSVLIVACPCALLLSATFTNGNLLRILQKNGIYLRDPLVIEQLAEADTIVFDKTGTITSNEGFETTYEGITLSKEDSQLIRSLTSQSIHPLSRAITLHLTECEKLNVKNFREIHGCGLEGEVYVAVNNIVLGRFMFGNKYREGFDSLVTSLQHRYKISVLSGDNDAERPYLQNMLGSESELLFDQLPEDKLNYIRSLQQKGRKVIMVGDGLNDAGALMQSNAGIAVSDDTNNFTPACDAVLEGTKLKQLNRFLNYCREGKNIIGGSFVLSILYNIIGLYFATSANLEPVIAAILMPLSSISIVLFTTGMSALAARKLKPH